MIVQILQMRLAFTRHPLHATAKWPGEDLGDFRVTVVIVRTKGNLTLAVLNLRVNRLGKGLFASQQVEQGGTDRVDVGGLARLPAALASQHL